ncbi:MAG: phosphatidate cytidylyltransferase [Treponema sp.]|nr:phosphatidate cytidylyltransferase [Treponema sp.]
MIHKRGIFVRSRIISFRKEIFRKIIHICSVFVPIGLHFFYNLTIFALALMLVVYIVAEVLRKHGRNVPVFSAITEAASRKRDENRFVLGPVTLCCGVLASALFFNETAAAVGILGLAAGDGLASLFGKMFGNVKIPFTGGKSVVGSLSCFGVIFLLTSIVTNNTVAGLVCGFVGMFVEMIPLKDFDNLLIPIVLASVVQFFF